MPAIFCRRIEDITDRITAVGGWGYKRSANIARNIARQVGLPYWAFEDGPLRSISPGIFEPSSSLIIDRKGIFYDYTSNSNLQSLFEDAAMISNREKEVAQNIRSLIVGSRLSKYNNYDPAWMPDNIRGLERDKSALVVDQTVGDAAIQGAGSTHLDFARMLDYLKENSDLKNIIVKTHPDVTAGLKKGMFNNLNNDPRIVLVSDNVCPWILFDQVKEVHTVSSLLGFEALMAEKDVHCWGAAFYSGRGLTTDHFDYSKLKRKEICIESAIYAYYLKYNTFFDHWSREKISIYDAIDQLLFLRKYFKTKFFRPNIRAPLVVARTFYKLCFQPKESRYRASSVQ